MDISKYTEYLDVPMIFINKFPHWPIVGVLCWRGVLVGMSTQASPQLLKFLDELPGGICDEIMFASQDGDRLCIDWFDDEPHPLYAPGEFVDVDGSTWQIIESLSRGAK